MTSASKQAVIGVLVGAVSFFGCDTKKGTPSARATESTDQVQATQAAPPDACTGVEGRWEATMSGDAPCAGSFFADKVEFVAKKNGAKWNLSAGSGGWGVAESSARDVADSGCVVVLVLSKDGGDAASQVSLTLKDRRLEGTVSHSGADCSSKAQLSGEKR